jgi:antitoxin ParD1/3/4
MTRFHAVKQALKWHQTIRWRVPAMETTSISVPEALEDFVRARIVECGYGNASEYIGELIRADQKQRALTVLGSELLIGQCSGPSEPMTGRDWQEIREEVRQRIDSRRSG